MILESEDLMVSPTGDSDPTLRKSHFLKPILNPQNQQPPPKPPLHSLPSNTNLSDLTKRVAFKGRPKPLKNWKAWVDDLEKTHQSLWKKVGIFDAIKASTYKIKRDNEIVVALAERWCPETNTFVFPWGEATVTLEDVMVLGGFSVLGVSVTDNSSSKDRNFIEIVTKLKDSINEIRNTGSGVSHMVFMKYFMGKGSFIEHAAFLVVWLARCVLPTSDFISKCSNLIPIAASLATGTKFALAPAVLASIYRGLSILKKKIVAWTSEGWDDGLKFELWAPFQLVQLWAWERFRMLAPRPMALLYGEPRLARWQNVTKLNIYTLRLDIESYGDTFLWRPFTVSLENWELPTFYSAKENWVMLNSEVDDELLSFARCLSPCELVGVDCLEQYLPHRVGMQFGYDQGIPDNVPRSDRRNPELAWSTYDKLFDGVKLYLPPRLSEGDVTLQYSDWWKSRVSASDDKFSKFNRGARSTRKIRKLSQIMHVETGDGGKTYPCSPVTCNETRASSTVETTTKMTKGGNSYKSWLSDEVTEAMPESAINLLMVVEKESQMWEHVVQEKDMDPVVKDCNAITDGASKGSEGSHSETSSRTAGEEAPTETKKPLAGQGTKHSCTVLAEPELGRAVPDIVKKEGNSTEGPLIVDSCEDMKSESGSFLDQISELGGRIRRLHGLIPLMEKPKIQSAMS